MATQGLVTVSQCGIVQMKIVVGIDGMHAPEVARRIREMGRTPTVDEAEEIAIGCGFGGEEDRVIITADDFLATDDELPRLYRSSFLNPMFNPRWEQGTADYVEIVEL